MLEPEPRSSPISMPELVFSILLLILFVFGLVGKIRRVSGHFAPIFSLASLPQWAANFHSLVLLDPRAILIWEPSLVSGSEPVVGTESHRFHLSRARLVPEILQRGIWELFSPASWILSHQATHKMIGCVRRRTRAALGMVVYDHCGLVC